MHAIFSSLLLAVAFGAAGTGPDRAARPDDVLEIHATCPTGGGGSMLLLARLWTTRPRVTVDGVEAPDGVEGEPVATTFALGKRDDRLPDAWGTVIRFEDPPRGPRAWVSIEPFSTRAFLPALVEVAPLDGEEGRHAPRVVEVALDGAGVARVAPGTPWDVRLDVLDVDGRPPLGFAERDPQDGALVVGGLDSGETVLRVARSGAGPPELHDVRVEVARGEAVTVLLPPSAPRVIGGTLRAPDGAALAGALYVHASPGRRPTSGAALPIGPDGRIEVRGRGLDGARVTLLVLPEPIERWGPITLAATLPVGELALVAAPRPARLVSLRVQPSVTDDVSMVVIRDGLASLRHDVGVAFGCANGMRVPQLELVPTGAAELWVWSPGEGRFHAQRTWLDDDAQDLVLRVAPRESPGELRLRVAAGLPDPLYLAIAPVGAEVAPRDAAQTGSPGLRLTSRAETLRGLPCDRPFALLAVTGDHRVVWRQDLRLTEADPIRAVVVGGG